MAPNKSTTITITPPTGNVGPRWGRHELGNGQVGATDGNQEAVPAAGDRLNEARIFGGVAERVT
jgi:hypothetical protein